MAKLSMDRILQSQGIGSRAECRALITRGEVAVDGKAVRDWKSVFETVGLSFTVGGAGWIYREKAYLALNKPSGYECSRAPAGHPSVFALLPDHLEKRGVQPVGRLDQDTTGLILLTDDGAFIHAQASPKRHVPKTYRASVADPATDDQIAALRGGVLLRDEEEPLAALSCERMEDREIEIVLEQGKYHQVKRMIAAAGNRCVALRRTAVGRLTLDSLNLDEGAWRYLDQAELAAAVSTER